MNHDEALALAQQRRKELADSAEALAERVRSAGAPFRRAQEALSAHPLWTLGGSFAVGFVFGHRRVHALTATAGSANTVPTRSRGWMFAATAGLARVLAREVARNLLDTLLLPSNSEGAHIDPSTPSPGIASVDRH